MKINSKIRLAIQTLLLVTLSLPQGGLGANEFAPTFPTQRFGFAWYSSSTKFFWFNEDSESDVAYRLREAEEIIREENSMKTLPQQEFPI